MNSEKVIMTTQRRTFKGCSCAQSIIWFIVAPTVYMQEQLLRLLHCAVKIPFFFLFINVFESILFSHSVILSIFSVNSFVDINILPVQSSMLYSLFFLFFSSSSLQFLFSFSFLLCIPLFLFTYSLFFSSSSAPFPYFSLAVSPSSPFNVFPLSTSESRAIRCFLYLLHHYLFRSFLFPQHFVIHQALMMMMMVSLCPS